MTEPSDKYRRTMEEIADEAVPQSADSDNDSPDADAKPCSEKSAHRVTNMEIEEVEADDGFSLRKPDTVSSVAVTSPFIAETSPLIAETSPLIAGASDKKAKTFSPHHKPKTPILYIMDDNQETAEAVRLRGVQTLIGRSRGDILLSNDAHVSDRHAEIRREIKEDTCTWILNDLKSTNGTYVQIHKRELNEGDCLLLGGKYFRFSKVDSALSNQTGPENYALVQFASARGEQQSVFMLNRSKENVVGNGQRWLNNQTWEDEFLEDDHAKIVCNTGKQWTIEDLASANGTWIKTDSIVLINGSSFQLGGQRFIFSIGE